MAYQSLEKLINLHDGYRRLVSVAGRQLLLLQEEGAPCLIERRCPHAGSLLDTAAVAQGCITCPAHQIRFDLQTGKPQNADCPPLTSYSLVFEGNSLGVEVSD